MVILSRLSVAVAAVLLGSTPLRAAETVVGVVTAVSKDSVHVKPKESERVFTLSPQTRYVIWITHKPWQQSDVADRSAVKVGRCVAVKLKAAGDQEAVDIVRVNTDEVGSIFCPCPSTH